MLHLLGLLSIYMKPRLPYLYLLLFLFASCNKYYLKQKENFTCYILKDSSIESVSTKNIISTYKTKMAGETEKVIATSTDALTRNGDESTLGNFVCDALKFVADSLFTLSKPDLIIVNRGGLRAELPKGEIKVSNIFELMPFENEVVLIKISGEKLERFLALFEHKKHPFFGARIRLSNNKAVDFLIDNKPLEKSKIYTLITSNYLSNGGDNFTFLKDPTSIIYSGKKIRDAIIDYCNYLTKNGKQIIPYTDERLEISK
jgi:2',3'-cyclic-nucleotide 2'-phosphodiesterase (5'-nucleotidase family)